MERSPLSVIIVNWNTRDLLHHCLSSVGDGQGVEDEIIVVDNGSEDGSAGMVQKDFPRALLIRNQRNLGFAVATNQGILASGGAYVTLLNSDTRLPKFALKELSHFMNQHQDAGAVGPRLVRMDGTPQAYGFGRDPTLGYLWFRFLKRALFHRAMHDWSTDAVQKVDWVSGACLMVRRRAMEEVGLLDEKYFMYFEDLDWCLRMRKRGWKVYYDPRVSVQHQGGQNLPQNPMARRGYYESLRYFYSKHYGTTAQFFLQMSLKIYLWKRKNEALHRH